MRGFDNIQKGDKVFIRCNDVMSIEVVRQVAKTIFNTDGGTYYRAYPYGQKTDGTRQDAYKHAVRIATDDDLLFIANREREAEAKMERLASFKAWRLRENRDGESYGTWENNELIVECSGYRYRVEEIGPVTPTSNHEAEGIGNERAR